MDIQQFWQLALIPNNVEDKSAFLREKLDTLSAQDIADFDELYSKQLRALWHWDIWKVAYVVCGCNSEYDFLDFCNWLISQGEAVCSSIKVKPDELAQLCEIPLKDNLPYPYIDELDLVAGLLYESKTSEELAYHSVTTYPPQGKKFKNKPKLLKAELPKLYNQYWLG